MKITPSFRTGAVVALTLAAGAAQAHPGHGELSLMAGWVHPFTGLDHLLAMVAVGLWSAAALPAARRVLGPLLFMGGLLAGALLVGVWPSSAHSLVEPGVALSVVMLAALMFGARRIPAPLGLGLIGAAALLHGVAHGSELAVGQSMAAYAAGFLAASATLHGLGLLAGAQLLRWQGWAWRVCAALIGTSGLWLLATRL